MSTRERIITILGLVGTFCMPWPGEPEPGGLAALHVRRACASGCAQTPSRLVPVRMPAHEAGSSGEAAYPLGRADRGPVWR